MTARFSAECDDVFIIFAHVFVTGDFTIAAVTLIDPCKWTSHGFTRDHGGENEKKKKS